MIDNFFQFIAGFEPFGFTSNDIKTSLFFIWFFLSGVVVFFVSRVLLARLKIKQYDSVFWLSLGLGLHWLNDFLSRMYWILWDALGNPSYMYGTWVLVLFALLVIGAAYIHIVELTPRFGKSKNFVRILTASIIFAIFGVSLFFTDFY